MKDCVEIMQSILLDAGVRTDIADWTRLWERMIAVFGVAEAELRLRRRRGSRDASTKLERIRSRRSLCA